MAGEHTERDVHRLLQTGHVMAQRPRGTEDLNYEKVIHLLPYFNLFQSYRLLLFDELLLLRGRIWETTAEYLWAV